MNRDSSVAGLASLVQSRGRNGDSVLVHMTPDEVQGLNALALAHGGQLSINPDTGLYEANFLKKLLPTIIGLALAPLTAGTSLAFLGNPLVAGALVGGVEGLRTGDLGRGLMAGLGAFGGAGLGAGLSAAAGTAGAAGTGAAGAAGNLTAEQIAANAIKNTGTFGYNSVIPAAQTATSAAAQTAGTEAAKQGFFNTLGRGAQALTSEAGRTAFMNAVPGGMTGLAAGGMSIANTITPEFKPPMSPEEEEQLYYQSYGYDPAQGRFLGGQFQRGYPGYPGYAAGGSVMPRANFDYPQAGISKSSYAPMIDYGRPQEVLDGYEVKLDPFTGEERFAEGGEVGMMAPDELRNFLTVDPGAPPPEPMDMPRNQEMDRTYVKPIWETLGMTREAYLNQAGRPPVGAPMPTTPLPEEPIEYPGLYNQKDKVLSPLVSRPDYYPTQTAPQQSLEQYYQSLLAPPQQRPADNSFMNYMQSFNNFVTSPIAPPKPAVQPPQTPPANPPGDPRVTGTGGTGTGMVYDPNTGKFVPGTGSPGDTGMDLSALQELVNSGMFSGFNFGDLGNFLQNGGYGSTTGLTFDPVTGTFRQPGTQTTTTPPGSPTTDLNQNQNQFNPDQFKFDPNNFQNPFVDGFDMSSLPGYGQNTTGQLPDDFMNSYLMQSPAGRSEPPPDFSQFDFTGATGNLTGIDQFADPMYNQPFQYDFSGLGQMNQMGDMGGYGTQFQGFQPLSTDFGSTYQAPAMNQPTFDYSAYMPQQMDFGSMGYGLGSLPSIASTYQPQAVETPTFDMSSFQMPASQSPMMTGGDMGMSNVSTAPQFGFGNSDVLYGRTDFGMGGGNNVFGFAEGGSVQRAAAGKLITGDGDGMSDDIRANISGNQEARLADGEFVIPADVVSHLGNGSTDAGADQLHAMMDRIRKARTGRARQAPEIDPDEFMPA